MIGRISIRARGRSAALAAAATLVAVTVAACGGGSSEGGGGSGGGALVVDSSFDLKTIDPGREYELTGQLLTKGMYETLLTFEGNDLTTPVGALATSYELSPDATTLTLPLAQGRVFSDGTPVTADDVVFSLQRLAGMKGNPSFLLDGVTVAKKDDATVVLTSAEPNPALPFILPNPALSIVNAEVVQANGGTTDESDAAEKFLNSASAGSGPYVLESLDVASQAVLTRNEAYNGPDRPAYDTVVVRNVKAATQALNVQKGDSQVALDLSGDQVQGLDAGRVTVTSGPSAYMIFLMLNQSAEISPATSNPQYVSAVKKAIDYPGLLGVAGAGAVQPGGIIPSLITGALPAAGALTHDPAGAAADLAASGMAGERPTLAYPSDLTLNGLSFQTIAERLQSQLAAAGIAVDLAPAPVATELDNYRNGKEQMGLWYWAPDFPDPSNYLAFAPDGLIGERANWTATAAPDIAAAATAADATVDPAQREAAYHRFQESLNAGGPFIPLVQPPSNIVTANSVTGAVYNPIWTVDLGDIGVDAAQ
ncbi:ABC transporter substrate-binding protein [Pseudonocardia sp. MH-G8]|uniref:ABC transporter substrate-binding protein n=1 Tax=Pseudonocardia sp. MH-G8 TaxID=1854588 RepID=UPI000B9FAA21|nr:ABC transporter substrate-binding protein [Pseudonocardia sp. MH-G8]OZM76226.1 ABC transporter substrate-binding protein [Pseudonocardia sp. MH-G8]